MSESVEAPSASRSTSPARSQHFTIIIGVVAVCAIALLVFAFRGGQAASGSDSAPRAVAQLKDKDFETRLAAAKSLLAMGADARPYAAEIEAALKDAAWEFATTVVPELGTNAEATFQTVGSTIKPPSPEDLRRQEARRLENERKQKECEAQAEKWKGYVLTLLKALEAADPDRMRAIHGHVVVQFLSEPPVTNNTFQSVGDTISPVP